MTSTEMAGRLQVYFGSDNQMRIATIRDYFKDADGAWLDALYLAAIERFEFMPTVAGLRDVGSRIFISPPRPRALPGPTEPYMSPEEGAKILQDLLNWLLNKNLHARAGKAKPTRDKGKQEVA